jgi:hypothetical protein
MFTKFLEAQLPPEFRKKSSIISIFSGLIVIGFLAELGAYIFHLIVGFAGSFSPVFVQNILKIFSYTLTIKINIITIVLFVLLFLLVFFSIYRLFNNILLKKGRTIFEDNFDFGNLGWKLNYWGSRDLEKTCRLEKSSIIFESENKDLLDPRMENGAYYDLYTGINKGSRYEISAWVKSTFETSMGFKLWVHDTKGDNDVKYPARFYTPDTTFEEIKVGFIGTSTQALRIHLHIKAGTGTIIINRVKVVKL